MGVAKKIRSGKSSIKGKPVIKAGPSQTEKITTHKSKGTLGKGGA